MIIKKYMQIINQIFQMKISFGKFHLLSVICYYQVMSKESKYILKSNEEYIKTKY